MIKERFLELKKEAADLRQQDWNTSNQVAAKDWKTYKIKIPNNKTTIKEYKGSDLPLYFKWQTGQYTWLWKVYIDDGRVKVIKIMRRNQGSSLDDIEFAVSTITSAFNHENKECDKSEWADLLTTFVMKLREL